MKKKTITIKLNLRKPNIVRLAGMAKLGNMTIERLIEAFVSDLTSSKESGGTDERDAAIQWYDGRKFNQESEMTFVQFLVANDYWEDDMWLRVIEGYYEKYASQEGEKAASFYDAMQEVFDYFRYMKGLTE